MRIGRRADVGNVVVEDEVVIQSDDTKSMTESVGLITTARQCKLL